MNGRIDLHIHTNCSDGTTSPAETLQIVRESGVSAFSITDHDTLSGLREIRDLSREDDPELITGLELSCSLDGHDLHLLAYMFDIENKPLLAALERFQESRNRRGRKMVEKLNELGIELNFEDVVSRAGSPVIGRPHVAEALLERGVVKSFDEAFRKYISNNAPAYVPKVNFTPSEAIDLVHRAGGMTSLAHPAVGDAGRYVEALVEIGLDGIEVYHSEHNIGDRTRFTDIAQRFGLAITGGSDYHGRGGRQSDIGSQKAPVELLDEMKRRVQEIRDMN